MMEILPLIFCKNSVTCVTCGLVEAWIGMFLWEMKWLFQVIGRVKVLTGQMENFPAFKRNRA